MPDLEKIIKGLKCCAAMSGDECRKCPYEHECRGTELPPYGVPHLAADALVLLKWQEPRVMTLDELYDAEYVFYEDDKIGVLCVLPCGNDEDDWYFTSAHCIIIQRRNDNYKKSWRCWTSRPTDEQRKEVKWNGDR